MAIIQVPAGLSVARQTWAQKRNDLSFSSSFGSQAVETSPPQWESAITASLKKPEVWQALMLQLRGQTNQLSMWNFGRPLPKGTMRGTMTLGTTLQGATSLVITATGQASKTLLAGDFLGVGSGVTQQVVMVVADATSNASGVITVTVEPGLRNAFTAGSSVTWDRPKALFRRKQGAASWDYEPGKISGMSLDLVEDWRP